MFNSQPSTGVPRGTNGHEQAFYRDCERLLSLNKAGPHINGITVNKSAQIVEGAPGGAFYFEDIYSPIDGSRFPVKRIVGGRLSTVVASSSGSSRTTIRPYSSIVWREVAP